MGSLVGFLVVFLLFFGLAFALGGIPFIVYAIMAEMGGSDHYMYSMVYLILVLYEFYVFFGCVFQYEPKLNKIYNFPKKMWKKLNKKIFRKAIYETYDYKDGSKSNETKKKQRKSISFEIAEIIILIIFSVVAIFYKHHSAILNLEYSNVFVRILAIDFIPLFIINTINSFRYDCYSFGDVFSELSFRIMLGLILGFAVSSTFFLVTMTQPKYNYIGNGYKSLFIYNNTKFDEIRKNANYNTEFELIENTLKEAMKKSKDNRDITSSTDMMYIERDTLSSVKQYGYTISNYGVNKDNPYVVYVKMIDKKNKEKQYYKVDFENEIVLESNKDEYNNALKD